MGVSPAAVKRPFGPRGARIGYDVSEAAYFHRLLPYNAAAVTKLNPRLVRPASTSAVDLTLVSQQMTAAPR